MVKVIILLPEILKTRQAVYFSTGYCKNISQNHHMLANDFFENLREATVRELENAARINDVSGIFVQLEKNMVTIETPKLDMLRRILKEARKTVPITAIHVDTRRGADTILGAI
jgi:hypothetical protein